MNGSPAHTSTGTALGGSGFKRSKGKGVCIAIYRNPYHNYGVSLAVWNHTVLPAARHKRTQWPLPQPDRPSTNKLEEITWKEAEVAAQNRSEWCRSVAQ